MQESLSPIEAFRRQLVVAERAQELTYHDVRLHIIRKVIG